MKTNKLFGPLFSFRKKAISGISLKIFFIAAMYVGLNLKLAKFLLKIFQENKKSVNILEVILDLRDLQCNGDFSLNPFLFTKTRIINVEL